MTSPARRRVTPDEAYRDYKRLVHFLAKRWLKRDVFRRQYEDLVQDGFEGLMRAVKAYDPTRGPFNTTFVYYYIREYIRLGATRIVGLTSRPKGRGGRNTARLHEDYLATDIEGGVFDPDDLPAPPTDEVELSDLVDKLEARLKRLARVYDHRARQVGRPPMGRRDVSIYAEAIMADRSYYSAGGKQGNRRGASDLAKRHGVSPQRVEQIVSKVGAEVRKWGEKIKREAA